MIGDPVNVAARLTSVAEGGKVWIGADTYELVRDYIEARPLEPLTAKGKREPIKAYEVVGIPAESVGLDGDVVGNFT